MVNQLPFPEHPLLKAAAIQTGLLGPNMIGLTLGYAVFIRRGNEESQRLLSHEFRHVQQYEAAGSIASFLPIYLKSVVALATQIHNMRWMRAPTRSKMPNPARNELGPNAAPNWRAAARPVG